MLNPLSNLDLDLSAIVTVPIIRFTDNQRYSLRFEISMIGREAKFSIKLRSKMNQILGHLMFEKIALVFSIVMIIVCSLS